MIGSSNLHKTNHSTSVASRALLALALMIGFYLLALGIVAALLAFPYLEVTHFHRIYFKLTIFCIVGAGAIFWAILPRADHFLEPGPRLTPQDQPELFHEISSVAQATGQANPEDVYLIPEVNAWVAQRGGIMGLGSRRVMGLGLALLKVLTVSQFRAVIAHEFGHFYSEDIKLGPWVYKTRATIARTLNALSQRSQILQLPFIWYGLLFLRISHAVSRRQEFTADALAAKTFGSRPMCEALLSLHGTALAFASYWTNEAVPVLRAGRFPKLLEGFEEYLHEEGVSRKMHELTEAELLSGESDPYDTHPPLRERLEALKELPEGEKAGADPSALTLLRDTPILEQDLLTFLRLPRRPA